MIQVNDVYWLHVPLIYGDGQPMLAALLRVIETRLRAEFAGVSEQRCANCGTCVVFAVDASERARVFSAARGIARLLQSVAWVGLPNGHIAVLNVEVDCFFA